MSAYIVHPAHVAALAAFAVESYHGHDAVIFEYKDANPLLSARRVAEELMRENIRSVATRYPNDTDGDRPGPGGLDAELISEAGALAERYHFERQPLSLVDVLKMCDGLEYQSCETDDYRETLAFRQLDRIRSAAINRLPGYEDAPWSYEGERHTKGAPC